MERKGTGGLQRPENSGNYCSGVSLPSGIEPLPVMGDQREFDLETRVITNGNNKSPRCFTVVH